MHFYDKPTFFWQLRTTILYNKQTFWNAQLTEDCRMGACTATRPKVIESRTCTTYGELVLEDTGAVYLASWQQCPVSVQIAEAVGDKRHFQRVDGKLAMCVLNHRQPRQLVRITALQISVKHAEIMSQFNGCDNGTISPQSAPSLTLTFIALLSKYFRHLRAHTSVNSLTVPVILNWWLFCQTGKEVGPGV